METAVISEEMVRQTELEQLETEAKELAVIDDATSKAAQLVISKCRQMERELETEKEEKTRPLLTQLDQTRTPYMKAMKFIEAIRKELDRRDGVYVLKLRQERAEQQRKEIEDYNRKQAELAQKSENERQAAAAARAAGDEKGAVKLEGKAEKAELKAATMEGPAVLPTVPTTVKLEDGSSLSRRTVKELVLPGRDLTKGKLSCDDSIFNDIDLNQYKGQLFWDVSKLNKAMNAGMKMPKPFQVVEGLSGSTVRGAK